MIVQTTDKREIIDITNQTMKQLNGSGVVTLFITHTTAALTTADLDPGTDKDLLDALDTMTPERQWRHPHNPAHFPDHLWGSILGPHLSIPFKQGKLLLGTWQRIILVELDGPRKREILVSVTEAELL